MRALLVVVAALVVHAATAQAALVTFTANLAPSGNSSPATGSALVTLDTVTNTYDVTLMVLNLDPANLSNPGPQGSPVHIHEGGPSETGPIVSNLGLSATRTDFGNFGFAYNGTDIAVSNDTEALMLANNTYINVHTNTYPGGEIRGQLIAATAIPEPHTAGLLALGAVGLVGYRIRRRRR